MLRSQHQTRVATVPVKIGDVIAQRIGCEQGQRIGVEQDVRFEVYIKGTTALAAPVFTLIRIGENGARSYNTYLTIAQFNPVKTVARTNTLMVPHTPVIILHIALV